MPAEALEAELDSVLRRERESDARGGAQLARAPVVRAPTAEHPRVCPRCAAAEAGRVSSSSCASAALRNVPMTLLLLCNMLIAVRKLVYVAYKVDTALQLYTNVCGCTL